MVRRAEPNYLSKDAPKILIILLDDVGFGLPDTFGGPIHTPTLSRLANYNGLMLAQFRWEGQQPLAEGKHTIVFEFTSDGPGIAKGGSGVLRVDGQDVATQKIPKTIPFLLPGDETFDIGVDTRTGVNDQDYQVPFPFNGTINNVTFKLGPVQLGEADKKIIQHAFARAGD